MSNDTGALSFQLDMYRWEDHVQRMQGIRESDGEQYTAESGVAEYNDLVHRYNMVAEAGLKAAQTADASQARVGEAEVELLSKDREIANLKQQLANAAYDLERSHAFWEKEADYYRDRAFAAEAELKELRSQKG